MKKLARARAQELANEIAAMQAMRCHGDARPECPIPDDLASPSSSA